MDGKSKPEYFGAWRCLTATGAHWLNAVKVVDYELWTSDWVRRVRESTFKDYPMYGRARRGHIGLQDHGDRVAFRNIKILELSK